MTDNLPPILPVGTRVVIDADVAPTSARPGCPRGSVGTVTEAPPEPTRKYRVRLVDGRELSLHRKKLRVEKTLGPDSEEIRDPVLAQYDLHQCVIYRCVVGSRAFGLDREGSDVDRRGIYLPPASLQWSIYGVPEQIENAAEEECYWELRKFIALALKANPNVLECLYTPMVEHATDLARELLDMRSCFLSRYIYQTYNGYVISQFKRFEQNRRQGREINWKHAMHLIRLLISGIGILREGELRVRVEENRDELIDIREGRRTIEEVEARRLALHEEFERAWMTSDLPERPDYDRANDFLVRARIHAYETDDRLRT